MLPDEIIAQLNTEFQCREQQIQQLAALYTMNITTRRSTDDHTRWTENLSALCVNLAKLLEGRGKFVLVLDAVDKLRESAGTLIAALGRLGESLFSILNNTPPKIFATPPSEEQFPDYTPDLAAEDDAWLWSRFISAVYDSLSKHTGRDLLSFRRTCMKLWRPFVEPVVTGQFGTRDFSRLIINRKHLFQVEDAVLDRIVADAEPQAALEPTTPSKRRVGEDDDPHATILHHTPPSSQRISASYNPLQDRPLHIS
ncbi:hypothetical protein SNOG_05550 [Parastagonospora nodorum SN15]|uniref:ORC5 lid domain-containing protein n=1 Tax=Phaeosphaeria nodorum (strain SN15 / ATCC MYA-4574 / FGSC 10173) TaxID=321614 RepID=Q0URR4_PHANO|nr:hypothetical protein SNOG_05550 [Parastagonospora nodorum SN15]EAT86614.2 hypothetical protein SNOG_05550 [Parastagonospora nodorum SN15]